MGRKQQSPHFSIAIAGTIEIPSPEPSNTQNAGELAALKNNIRNGSPAVVAESGLGVASREILMAQPKYTVYKCRWFVGENEFSCG